MKTVGKAILAGMLACSISLSAHADISEKDFNAAMERYLKSDKGAEAIGSAMERHFQKKQQEAQKNQEDQAKAEMEKQFKNPVKIEVGKSPAQGPASARITIIEFSDFQCPFCKRGYKTMEEVQKMYPNDVKVVFKHFPLGFHPEAMPAAKATWAAQQQGKFWEFHNALFENQDKLGADFYKKTAADLKLDIAKFEKDMKSPEADAQIKADMDIAQKNGIQGTPGFFVNGVAVKGAYPAGHFKTIIDRWLGETK